jgi:pyruvate carboxylase
MLLAKTKADKAMTEINRIKGLNILFSDMPALFMAVSSLCSDNAPMVMMLDMSTAKGRAMLTILAEAKTNNFKITKNSKSLPNKSSMYNQMNCNSKMNKETKNVMMKGPMKAFNKTSDIFFG